MQHGNNDDTEDLRRERRSLLGMIDRRAAQIIRRAAERDRYRQRLRLVEAILRERGELREKRAKT